MRLLVAALLSILCSSSFAQVYKWQAPDGSIIFSDEPPPGGAQQVPVEPVQTYTPPPTPSPSAGAPKPAAAAPAQDTKAPVSYKRFAIALPANDEGVRSNNGEVMVQVDIEPGLDSENGHQVVVLLDGKVVAGPSPSTSFTLAAVERGTHTLAAEIRDQSGKSVKRSSSISFHLLRTTANR